MLHEAGFIKPVQVTFLTTNTCTAKCNHCSVHSSPDRKGSLTSVQMIETIDQLVELGQLGLVIFAGGEPTLLGKQLLETIAHADGLGLMTRMVTNAHWATSPATARAKLIELREAGLREINLSCDDFHTPYIPLERIVFAWHESKTLGFDSVIIASASGPQTELTPDRIRELLGEDVPVYYDDDGYRVKTLSVDDGSVRMISNSKISRLGRGKTIPIQQVRLPKRQDELDLPCPWISSSPAVSPNNHLLTCCGTEANGLQHLDYGALDGASVKGLLGKAEQDVLIAALSLLGPYRIMKLLQRFEPDAKFWTHYVGICEVCESIFSRPEIVELLHKHLSSFQIFVSVAQRRNQKILLNSKTA